MPWLDLLIIGLVLAVVVSRFFSFKLPTDTRDKAARKAEFENLFGRRKAARTAEQFEEPVQPAGDEEPAQQPSPRARRNAAAEPRLVGQLEGIDQIKALDPGFDQADFLNGAIAAYQYFYDCYNARDQEGIINLCGPQLEQDVMAEWQENPAKVVVETEPTAQLQRARVNGRTAVLDVAFSATHRVGKGAPKAVRSVWVFARALNSPDPNWELQSYKTQADA